MLKVFLLIGIGGFLGSTARFATQKFISAQFQSTFPYATFFINIFGCFLIGILAALMEKTKILPTEVHRFLSVGFCGGFTTFSTFALESVNLMKNGKFLETSAYVTLSVFLGFLATFLGIFLVKNFFKEINY